MDRQILAAVQDIRSAIERIEIYTQGQTFTEFYNSPFHREATERALSRIGEAATRLRNLGSTDIINDQKAIIAFRNYLMQGYDKVDYGDIWHIINADLPGLKEQTGFILSQYPVHDNQLPD